VSSLSTPFSNPWLEHVRTPPASQKLYADAEQLRVSLKRFSRANWPYLGEGARWLQPLTANVGETLEGLSNELCRERHHGALFASPSAIAPDPQWVKRLEQLESGNPKIEGVMALLRDLYPPAVSLANRCQRFYEEGKQHNLPLPLLSALKTTIAVLDAFASVAPLEQEISRLRSDLQTVTQVAKMLELPVAKRLQQAASALAESA
jgi:hypothetical protein